MIFSPPPLAYPDSRNCRRMSAKHCSCACYPHSVAKPMEQHGGQHKQPVVLVGGGLCCQVNPACAHAHCASQQGELHRQYGHDQGDVRVPALPCAHFWYEVWTSGRSTGAAFYHTHWHTSPGKGHHDDYSMPIPQLYHLLAMVVSNDTLLEQYENAVSVYVVLKVLYAFLFSSHNIRHHPGMRWVLPNTSQLYCRRITPQCHGKGKHPKPSTEAVVCQQPTQM